MNKYLEKLAGLTIDKDTHVGRVDEPLKAKAPGTKLTTGAKTLFSKALLHKVAAQATAETTGKQDAINTGVIGGLGAVAGFAAHKGMKAAPGLFGEATRFHNPKLLAVSGAAGLAADYAGLKINKQINKHVK